MLIGLSWADAVGRSLRQSFFMFWATLWPLILGFGLSGAVQAFVSMDAMRRRLGDHRPAAVIRASAFGMLSSSCSYAATAMAKSLFVKGADLVAAMVFMFASTNLVIELGIVLIVLMGWQFAASEFIGGILMIILLSLLGGLWLRGRLVTAARQRLTADSGPGRADKDAELNQGSHPHGPASGAAARREPWTRRARSRQGWADSATYTMADITMLRRELAIGYLAAGFLAALVPAWAWHIVFQPGHGFWTTAENAVIGPLLAVVSFVCSIGNVPLAAALWADGISFGGVISFIFADLIALPLLLIYRRYYGTSLMLRMLAVFWLVMAVAGLITEGIFRGAGLVPAASRPGLIVAGSFSWNYTSYLNIIFLVVLGLLYLAYRHRERLGGGAGYALDPVCGMQVETAHAPATLVHAGQSRYFCSDRCLARFADAAAVTS